MFIRDPYRNRTQHRRAASVLALVLLLRCYASSSRGEHVAGHFLLCGRRQHHHSRLSTGHIAVLDQRQQVAFTDCLRGGRVCRYTRGRAVGRAGKHRSRTTTCAVVVGDDPAGQVSGSRRRRGVTHCRTLMPYAARKDVLLLALELLAELRHLVAHLRLAARFGKRLRTTGNDHYLPRDLAVVAKPLRSIQRRTGELVAVNLLVAGSRRQFISQPLNIVALGRALSNVGNERGFSQLCYRGAFYSPLLCISA